MAQPPLLSLQDISLTFGGTQLLESAELIVSPGQRIALVGRNGSGKSTLLKIAAGLIQHDGGKRFAEPSATIRYLAQEPDLKGYATTLAYVEAGLAPGDDSYRAQYLLDALGMTGQEDPSTLSGGEGRRAALARVLAPQPDVLLLDEPTNHLDLPVIEWLQDELSSMRSALVLISHDRRFLSDLTRSTVWLDRGLTRRIEKGFSAFEGWRDEVLENEEKERHKLDRQIVREEHWLRYGVTARRKRNVGRLERLSGLRQDRRDQRKVQGSVTLAVSEGRTSGALVAEADMVSKSFGERTVVREFSTRVLRGDRVGIVGPNGAGKTTLIKMLTGLLEPDTGTIKLGSAIELAMLDQGRAKLEPETRLRDALTGGGSDTIHINGEPKHVVGYMKDFLFTPEQANTPIGKLSGGERARVALARALSLPSNFLVLDEPTNDLDLETLDLLEEMVSDYAGTVVVVSHDRDFLDRVATSVIMAEGNGDWTEYAGGYSDMVSQRGAGVSARVVEKASKAEKRKAEAAAAAAQPAKRKMSFKEKHALETLPKDIEKLDAEIKAVNAKLADANFYVRDPNGFASQTNALAALETKKAKAEEQWLELEMLREEIEG
ncbi:MULTISPECIES: ATP-binding cassette domain-containing protein [unclassified Devosia]|uniref:ABC-F family ATP-binding cassette domain-containing protein n=1 Tax=unclassified Devosia TaxID=196773 RepID=UPI0015FA1F30|nr:MULTISPECIES: ATP-binding cassette domain-containing protein [unclassified Devosia]MBJ6989082.1 ATP-binding cassette domain-containing protein [Devosia sp. MC521]MBJ7579407.1 ATP-binding cassette domain-containing protein [Devosia sp. MC532]QMW62924.1 ATP-binding cassette domain-containing protein [Devosia sp. MC521]